MKIKLSTPIYKSRRGKRLSIKDNNIERYQNYYCLYSNGEISKPSKEIQIYMRYIAKKSRGFPKNEAIEINLNRKRYIVSREEELLIAINDKSILPDRCYDFYTVQE